MTTSKNSKGGVLVQSTLSQEVFPVSPSRQLGSDAERKMTATSGQKCYALYERRLPAGSLVKTLAASLLGTEVWCSTKCTLTWKGKVTRSGRLLFQLLPSVPRTGEIGSGLLLTPTVVQTEERPEALRARAERNGYKNGTKWGSLASQVKHGFLATPTTMDHMAPKTEKAVHREATVTRKGRTKFANLRDQLHHGLLLPTPRANEAQGSAYQYDKGDKTKPRPTLTGMVQLLPTPRANKWGFPDSHGKSPLIPTPTARDSRGTGKLGHKPRDGLDYLLEKGTRKGEIVGAPTGLKLQPSFALWMMGFPTDWCDLKDGEMPRSNRPVMQSSPKSPLKS